jgi:histidine triad (HIT) family protein
MAKPRANTVTDQGNASCLFCRIVARDAQASIIFEDHLSVAFLDIRPLFPGHTLLIPKAHFRTLADLPPDLIGPFFANAQRLAGVIQEVIQAEGTFLGMNNIVSQSVPHFHIHIVPRRKGDGLKGFFWPRRAYQGDELTTVHESLASRLRLGSHP